jgi:hypothetical protein
MAVFSLKGALIFGHNRDRPGVLIDPILPINVDEKDVDQVVNIRNQVWPTVMKANAIAPAYSKIYKEMILFASPPKPVDYNFKGVMTRKAVLSQYKAEIDQL